MNAVVMQLHNAGISYVMPAIYISREIMLEERCFASLNASLKEKELN